MDLFEPKPVWVSRDSLPTSIFGMYLIDTISIRFVSVSSRSPQISEDSYSKTHSLASGGLARKNNRIQYNLAWFRRLEKFTNNGLNKIDFDFRRDDVFAANLYWQDLWILGHTAQFTVVHNRNRERGDFIFDDNGVIARPASLFSERFARDYDVTYLGFNTDGHLGRLNLTTSLYAALGDQTNDRFRDVQIALKVFSARLRPGGMTTGFVIASPGLYATGDDDPYDQKAGGFDAIFENPLFAGADTSFWIRQPVPLIGGGVGITGRNGVLNSLRSSKEHGQSNFINPGTMLWGLASTLTLRRPSVSP